MRIEWITHKGGGISLLERFAILVLTDKAPGTTKIIFCAGSAQSRPIAIPIQVDLYLSFSPPITFKRSPGQVGANILAGPFHLIKDGIVLTQCRYFFSTPLGMKVQSILWNFSYFGVVNL